MNATQRLYTVCIRGRLLAGSDGCLLGGLLLFFKVISETFAVFHADVWSGLLSLLLFFMNRQMEAIVDQDKTGKGLPIGNPFPVSHAMSMQTNVRCLP